MRIIRGGKDSSEMDSCFRGRDDLKDVARFFRLPGVDGFVHRSKAGGEGIGDAELHFRFPP